MLPTQRTEHLSRIFLFVLVSVFQASLGFEDMARLTHVVINDCICETVLWGRHADCWRGSVAEP